MTNFTQNNHLRYSIGGREYGYREASHEKFELSVGAVDPDQYRISSYEKELRRTADSVYKEFGKDLVVFLSGGTDSEIVVNNFLSIGIKPRCVTIKFKDDYNLSDVNEAERLATELGLDLTVIDFDIKDFFYSGAAEEFGKTVQCTQITYIMVYYNVMKMSAPAAMGGEALLTRAVSLDNSYWYYTFRENEDASAMRFSNQYNIPLVNEWFSYTPELLLYYLENPSIQELTTDRFNYKLTSVSSKNKILKRLCPYVTPKKKTHGFESLLAFNHLAYKDIGKDQIKRLEHSLDGIPMKTILQQLRAKL
jgi:hypothetical protein